MDPQSQPSPNAQPSPSPDPRGADSRDPDTRDAGSRDPHAQDPHAHDPHAHDPLPYDWRLAGDVPPVAGPRRSYVSTDERPRAWVRPGLVAGAVAAAATAGVLVRYGVTAGVGALGAFTHVGRLLLGVAETDGAPARWGATLAGLVVHVIVVTGWALVFAAFVGRRGGLARWGLAVTVSGLAWLAGQTVLPAMLRLGHGVRAHPTQALLLHGVLAVALAFGMRLALRERDGR